LTLTTLLRSALAALILASAATGALAQQLRPIPMDAKRGQMRHLETMQVEVNGERMQLAPGAQIRDRANMIVLPGALPSGSLVKYTRDPQGQIARVWILTPQEAAQPDPVTK
jgi:hypothetical protein